MHLEQQVEIMRRELERQAEYHRQQLDFLPSGKIAFHKNGRYVKWLHKENGGSGECTLINRKNRFLAEDLTLKGYHQEMLSVLGEQLRLLDQFHSAASSVMSSSEIPYLTSGLAHEISSALTAGIRYANQRVRNTSAGISARSSLAATASPTAVPSLVAGNHRPVQTSSHTNQAAPKSQPAESSKTAVSAPVSSFLVRQELLTAALCRSGKWMTDWCREAYECSDYRLNELRVMAKCGLLVRSKSEAFIADLLYECRIPFRYEQVLHVGDYVFCPDFTILLPDSSMIYWEHLGALGKAGYLQDTQRKLCKYLEAGIYPSRDLLLTCEDGGRPLDLKDVEWILRMLCSRYMSGAPFTSSSQEIPLMA